jgi:hypothetical protein
MKYCHDFFTIDHRYFYLPFTCLSLYSERDEIAFCLLSLTFLPTKRWLCIGTQKAQIAFPTGVKNLIVARH